MLAEHQKLAERVIAAIEADQASHQSSELKMKMKLCVKLFQRKLGEIQTDFLVESGSSDPNHSFPEVPNQADSFE